MADGTNTVSAIGVQQPVANANEAEKARVYAEIKKLEQEYSAKGGGDNKLLDKINELKDQHRALCGVKITPENSCRRKSNNDLFGVNKSFSLDKLTPEQRENYKKGYNDGYFEVNEINSKNPSGAQIETNSNIIPQDIQTILSKYGNNINDAYINNKMTPEEKEIIQKFIAF